MTELFSDTTFLCLLLTLGCFTIGSACQKKWKLAVLNPIVIAAVLIIGVLSALDVPFTVYQPGCQALQFLLTPATICLAISFYEQLQALKGKLPAVLAGVLAGTVCSLLTVAAMAKLFSLDAAVTISLLPKSVTTAIGLPLSQEAGGIGALTTAVIILTGVLGSVIGPMLCKLFRLRDPVAQGAALGTSAHVIGTTRAAQMSELAGAVSSLSLTVAGIVTAVIFSVFLR